MKSFEETKIICKNDENNAVYVSTSKDGSSLFIQQTNPESGISDRQFHNIVLNEEQAKTLMDILRESFT